MHISQRFIFLFVLLNLFFCWPVSASTPATEPGLSSWLEQLLSGRNGRSGAYILDKGEESLLARAWLADHAELSIDIQYFIWSTDNIGTLAAEALLRAAERGVKARVLVDDLLIDADDESLLALAAHPLIEIKIYNPKHKVGTSKAKRALNIFSDFRSINQRMHDKTFMVDGLSAITGGRNMADEYYDYDHHYNFRDRDILLIGAVVTDMTDSFNRFWDSSLSVPVETLLANQLSKLSAERVAFIYRELHSYAANPENFAPEVRQALADLPEGFPALIDNMVWDKVQFISDLPGKNPGNQGLGGGGQTTHMLAGALRQAKSSVIIQSPYLVMPKGGLELFRSLIQRGVEVKVSTNSLLSTDNLQAFSGFSKQREKLLQAGIDIFEFKPKPVIQRKLIERYRKLEKKAPIFAIHAKTMVIDSTILFVGTFNLDPRSANLNTEAGVVIHNPQLATQVEEKIREDMLPENSWDSRHEKPDRHAPLIKRVKLKFWKILPLDPLL